MADFTDAIKNVAAKLIDDLELKDNEGAIIEYIDSANCEGADADEAVDNTLSEAPSTMPDGIFEKFKEGLEQEKESVKSAYEQLHSI